MAEIKALELIRNNEKSVRKLLAPSGMQMSFFAHAIEAHLRANPKLLNCTPMSVVGCILMAAQTGQIPGMGNQIHFVPYGNECKPIMGYNGLRDLVERTGKVKDSAAHLVYANDIFKIDYSKEPPFIHEPCLNKERGDIIGAYGLVYKTNGLTKIEWMDMKDIEAIRNRSKAKDNGPWITDRAEMIIKTPYRRALKREKLGFLVDIAIELDNRAESGQSIRDFIDLEPGEFKELDEAPRLETGKMTAGTPTGYRNKKKSEPPKEEAPKVEPKQEAKVDDEINLDDDDPYKEM